MATVIARCRCPECRRQFDGPVNPGITRVKQPKCAGRPRTVFAVECLACTTKDAAPAMAQQYAARYEATMWRLSGWLSVEGGVV